MKYLFITYHSILSNTLRESMFILKSFFCPIHYSDVKWAARRLNSTAVVLLVQQPVQGNLPVTSRFPSERANNADSVSMSRRCSYSAVPFITIWHAALQCQQQNMNQTWSSQQTPHSSPSRASYGVSVVGILRKIDRVITAQHCIIVLLSIFFAGHRCLYGSSLVVFNWLLQVRQTQ